jgi:hypothetical protein
MDCDILAHGGRSSNNGSTEKDLYKHWHGDHGRGICNTSQRAKLECGEGAMPGLVISDSMERVEAAPLWLHAWPHVATFQRFKGFDRFSMRHLRACESSPEECMSVQRGAHNPGFV